MLHITLLSDFGLKDASVAIARGILLQHLPDAHIADITHEIDPFNIKQAAYLLGGSWNSFPEGTIHLPLFDIYYDQSPTLVLTTNNSHFFLSPDNGLLPLALGLETITGYKCFALEKVYSFHDWLDAAARVASRLQTHDPAGLHLEPITLKAPLISSTVSGNTIACEIIHIDKYENVVISFNRRQFEALAPGSFSKLQFIQYEEINKISDNYNDVREGFKLCRFNNNGFLEIAVNQGKAASLFGLKPGSEHNQIKIILQ